MVDWVDERGKTLRTDTLLGLKGTDDGFRSSQTVVRFGLGKGWPVLRFEHLGRSGRMELRDLKIMPVKSHPLIRMIVVALLAGGGIWFVSWLRLLSVAAWWRCLLGGGGLLAMIWLLVVPGPWAHPRPFGNCFRTGGSAADVEVVEFPNADNKKANSPEPLGKMPIQGSWLVKVKIVLSLLRPVLHVLLFAIPAAGLAFLCGVRCAALSMVAMTILVELSQAWFWFGFDWVDGFDLLTDWGGIGVALWGYQRVLRSIPTHGPVGMLKRMAFPLPQPS